MTKLGLVTAATMAFSLMGAATPGWGMRVETFLNAGWRFHRGGVANGQSDTIDVSDWAPVTLPHSFNGGDGDRGGGYYRGPGWYRRTLPISALPKGKRAYLEFDGAALRTDVFVNGREIGRHDGGFARFRFDVTDALHVGSNMIAVMVDNSRALGIAPLGGDFTVFGGLYRPVSLVETDDVHIDLLDHGGPGVYADVRSITARRADVMATVMVRNDAAEARNVAVTVTIEDQSGQPVATATATITVAARSSRTVPLALAIAEPHRWDGRADPYLYRLVAQIRTGGPSTPALDEQDIPLGLRSATFDPKRGFLLNGHPYPLHGVDYFHPERAGVGTAVSDSQIDEDMATIDDMGATALRLVHFQHPQRVYDDADRLGLPIWTEIPLNGVIDHAPAFKANAEEQMRELIAQNRNHPSVVLWGLGNEVYATDPAVTATLKAVQAVAHDADRTRPTVYAHCCQADDDPKAAVSDVIGFNRYFGWYPEQSGSIGAWADGYHARFPGRAFAVSEYGAGGSVLQQQSPPLPINQPGGAWHPEQAQTAYHIENWRALRDRQYLFGSYVWVAFDVASDGRHEGDRPGINDKGLVTYDRAIRKDSFYWYQANWSARPMLHVLDRRLSVRTQKTADISVVSNLSAVTLSIDDRVVATTPVLDHIARFEGVALSIGTNRITASGIADGARVTDEIEWVRQAPSSFGVTSVPVIERPATVHTAAKAPPGQ